MKYREKAIQRVGDEIPHAEVTVRSATRGAKRAAGPRILADEVQQR